MPEWEGPRKDPGRMRKGGWGGRLEGRRGRGRRGGGAGGEEEEEGWMKRTDR